jgi:hypothetical protein
MSYASLLFIKFTVPSSSLSSRWGRPAWVSFTLQPARRTYLGDILLSNRNRLGLAWLTLPEFLLSSAMYFERSSLLFQCVSADLFSGCNSTRRRLPSGFLANAFLNILPSKVSTCKVQTQISNLLPDDKPLRSLLLQAWAINLAQYRSHSYFHAEVDMF